MLLISSVVVRGPLLLVALMPNPMIALIFGRSAMLLRVLRERTFVRMRKSCWAEGQPGLKGHGFAPMSL